jgi:hypothetical protein
MKTFVLLISVLFAATVAGSQVPAAPQAPGSLQVVKYSWAKDRINWQGDPFRSTAENVFNARSRVNQERRTGTGTALEQRQNRDQNADKNKPPAPPRYVFSYKLTVLNTGPKAIKEIDWDYLFKDAATGEELGRRAFTSMEKIGPGKRKELSVLLTSPPTQRISVKSIGQNEHDGMVEQVIIVRILYEDGTTWQAR